MNEQVLIQGRATNVLHELEFKYCMEENYGMQELLMVFIRVIGRRVIGLTSRSIAHGEAITS